jgi:hypothetical protein
MQKVGEDLHLSSVDLVGHLNCRHLTELDLKVACGELETRIIWDPVLETLAERGAAHEQAFIDHLKAEGTSVTVIDGVGLDPSSFSATRDATYRVADYAAYYRHVRTSLERAITEPPRRGR